MSNASDESKPSSGPGIFWIAVLIIFLLFAAYIAKDEWIGLTGIPPLDPRSPARDETRKLLIDAMLAIDASGSPASVKEAKTKFLDGYRNVLLSDKRATLEDVRENITKYITNELLPAEKTAPSSRQSSVELSIQKSPRKTRRKASISKEVDASSKDASNPNTD